ncbi:helix-turn-helix domain-containing protein [Streptomyces albidoflavus]
MPINQNPTVRQRRLARRLKELRVQAGLTHADLAEELGSAESKVGRIEGAQSGIRLPDLRAWMNATGVTDPDERAEIEELSREARKKGWWFQYAKSVHPAYTAYVAVEWDAAEIYNVETHLIPGLLQTPEYTRELFSILTPDLPKEETEAKIEVRKKRREALTRENPLQLWAIISESLLHHRVGSADTMREQLESLIEDSKRPNVHLQVLPQDDPINACLFGPFVIVSYASPSETDIACTEGTVGALYYEEPDEVEKYTRLFRRLNMAAANVEKSQAFIRNALRKWSDQ